MNVDFYLQKVRTHWNRLMDEIAKSVIDPQTGVSVFERAKAHRCYINNTILKQEKKY